MPSVLVLLAEGFEEVEFVAPVDLMRRAGIDVTTAAVGEGIHVTGRTGITLHADTTLSVVGSKPFDMIFVPGGPGVKSLRADMRIAQLLRDQDKAGRWIASICAAALVLKDAGLLTNRRFTAHFSVKDELPDLIENERVVVDGRLVTSRGAGTAVEFALAIVALLISAEKSQEVAKSICL